MQFFLPVKALTVNRLWKGRHFKTAEYTAYEKELWAYLPKGKGVPGDVEVTVEFFVKNKQNDLDNLLKALFDVFTKFKIWDDDNRVMAIHTYKINDQPENTPGIRVTITPFV